MPDVGLSVASEAEPFYCAVAKTSTKGRCTTVCVRLTHGGRHCSDDKPPVPPFAREVEHTPRGREGIVK